jgi:hypothetical protein
LSKDLQIGFKVKGLGAPEKEMVFDDYVLIRGVPHSDASYVFFKVAIQKKEEIDKLADDSMNILRNALQLYSIVKNVYTEVMPSWVTAEISPEHPFGYPKYSPEFRLVARIGDEQRVKNIPFLNKTVAKYESVKDIFQNKNKAFLKNAMDYYHRSLGDFRLEEKLIDLMISLESLFSREAQELRLRISLRASSLLSVGKESERSKIFRKIYQLYDKRSKVVHGTELVNLDIFEISILQEYVREATKRLIHIEMSKKDILKLLDESIYDEEKRELLNGKILEAIKKW